MIYLNNSASSYPKPLSVIEGVNKSLSIAPIDYLRSGYCNKAYDIINDTRKLIVDFFGAPKPDHVIFTSGATESLNLVIKGVIKKGDHVITTSTEHNSVLRPLKTLEKQETISLSIVECDQYGVVAPKNIKDEITNATSLIVINHASNVTGTVQDIKQVSKIANEENIKILLDASQSAGSIPINFTELGVDYMAFTGHKYLLALTGIGGLIIKEGNTPTPLKTGGTGIKSNYLYQPEEMPLQYEAGTLNITGITSIYYGIKFIMNTGINIINNKKGGLIDKFITATKNNKSLRLIGYSRNIEQLPVINFLINGFTVEDTIYILENSFNIIARAGLHCAPLIHEHIGSNKEGTIRISPSFFNTKEDIDKLIAAVNIISKAA